MGDKLRFFILLLERFASDEGVSAADILQRWDEAGITQEVYDGYEAYHQEPLQNAYRDIESLLATGEHAW